VSEIEAWLTRINVLASRMDEIEIDAIYAANWGYVIDYVTMF
jgi:hypothetical protein